MSGQQAGKGHRIVALATEWYSGKGGMSTLNRQLCGALADAGADVFCYVPKYSPEERRGAESAGVRLIEPTELPGGLVPEVLMRRAEFPDEKPPDIIIGHGRKTGPAAKVQADDFFRGAARIHIVHTMPDEIEFMKPGRYRDSGERADERTRIEENLARGATVAAAVGPRVFSWFQQPRLSHFRGYDRSGSAGWRRSSRDERKGLTGQARNRDTRYELP